MGGTRVGGSGGWYSCTLRFTFTRTTHPNLLGLSTRPEEGLSAGRPRTCKSPDRYESERQSECSERSCDQGSCMSNNSEQLVLLLVVPTELLTLGRLDLVGE